MIANWVKQTTTTTGTGALTLAAVTGFVRFTDAIGIGRIFPYTILNADGTPVESGLGRLTDATTMTRVKILTTDVAGTYTDTGASAVSLAAGTYTVALAADASLHTFNAPDVNKFLNQANSSYTNGPRWVVSGNRNGNSSTATITTSFVCYAAFRLDNPVDVTSMGLYVTTASAGATCGLALYECSEKGIPGAKLFETSSVLDLSVTGMVSATVTTRRRLAPGWYFVGYANVGSATLKSYGTNGTDTVNLGCPIVVHTGGDWTKYSYSENKGSTVNTLPATPNPNDFFGTHAVAYLGIA